MSVVVCENDPCVGWSCRQVKSATRTLTLKAGAASSEKKPLFGLGVTQAGRLQSSPGTSATTSLAGTSPAPAIGKKKKRTQ